jgi:hypothetical protein
MDNLDFGNIAIGVSIVGILNLLIVMLVKTETILNSIERIKSIIRVDYKTRAKRSDDELRLLKKYEQIAYERIKKTFITFTVYGCRWTWNWTTDLEPKNIKGRCCECEQPVYAHFAKGPTKKSQRLDTLIYVGLYCPSYDKEVCGNSRSYFHALESENEDLSADEIVNKILIETIVGERTKRIAKEVKKLQMQFWR